MNTTIPTLHVGQAALAVSACSVVFGFLSLDIDRQSFAGFGILCAIAAIIMASRIVDSTEKLRVNVLAVLAIVASLGGIVLAVLALNQRVHTPSIRSESRTKLINIGGAMHAYHEKHGHLPPAAVYDKTGKPLLSWRVLLLPYLEEEELFKRFHLDEPWDSPHNIQLLKEMPRAYARLNVVPADDGYSTIFQVFTGPGSVFDGEQVLTLDEIDKADGTGQTMLAVEAMELVPWTKPQDLVYQPDKPLPKIGRPIGKRMRNGDFEAKNTPVLMLRADGSVRSLPPEISDEQLRAMITWDGGEKVEWP